MTNDLLPDEIDDALAWWRNCPSEKWDSKYARQIDKLVLAGLESTPNKTAEVDLERLKRVVRGEKEKRYDMDYTYDLGWNAAIRAVQASGHLATGKGGDDVTGDTSDGYHTFNELYEHRHALFAALLRCYPTEAWKSKLHNDGTMFDGWFIAGIHTPEGNATYHIPMRLWDTFEAHEVDTAPKWDGHTPADVITRIGHLATGKGGGACICSGEIDPIAAKAAGKDLEYFEKEFPQTSYETRFASALQMYGKSLMEQGKLTEQQQPAAPTQIDAGELEGLKSALRDVLKAIVSDRHAVQDTIWVNGTPVGDFIMCALDEEIDLDELQNAPYRCKRTGELLPDAVSKIRFWAKGIYKTIHHTSMEDNDQQHISHCTQWIEEECDRLEAARAHLEKSKGGV